MRRNVFKKGLIVVLLLLIFTVSLVSAEEKKYPPYPDVWGVELPWVDENNRNSIESIDKMPDGDYRIGYLKKWEWVKFPKDSYKKYEGIYFFSQRILTHNEYIKIKSPRDHVYDRLKIGKIEKGFKTKEIVFSDGSKITAEHMSEFGRGSCSFTFEDYITKTNKDGTVVFSKSLVYLPTKPIKNYIVTTTVDLKFDERCKYHQARKRDYVLRKVDQITPIFIPLEDETFLIVDVEGNIIIRFDKDLNTKINLVDRKVFLVDKEVVKDIINTLGEKKNDDQAIVDAVYKHIQKLKVRGGSHGNNK